MKNISSEEREKFKERKKSSQEKVIFDLSGNNWQMEGISEGEGVKRGFHELNFDITGDAFNWTYAQVPGDVYTDLFRSGRIDDPHFGRNSLKAKWIPENEWWYKRQFDVPQEMNGKLIQLIFEGVDFACDVWLNGEFLGSHEGMFSSFKFDVSDTIRFERLRFGTNVLMVRLHPAPRRYSQVAGRKPAWHGDYWVSLPPTGIWKPVVLEATERATIEDVYINQKNISADSAEMTFEVEVKNHQSQNTKALLKFILQGKNHETETIQFTQGISLEPGESKFTFDFVLEDPKLWWPWDLGDQNLYILKTEIVLQQEDKEILSDTKDTIFGIRKIEMIKNPGFTDEEVENPWTVLINNQRHFIRSGTWGGPPDIFMGRAHPNKYRTLIQYAKEANFNNLRIFGWHPEEIPLFYQLCDEAGITVWQDVLPLASLSLPKDEEFKNAVYNEAIHSVKAQRNHPSIILLEGSEELFMTASDPEHNLEFINQLGEAIKPYTPLHFIPSSPLSDEVGLRLGFKPKESFHANDLFYGEGEFMMEDYFPSLDYAVIPELAISSCPSVESIKKFIPKNELWAPGPSWGHHWTDFDVLRILNFEVTGSEATESMENFVTATQIAQGVIFQFALEHFRRRKPRTSAICICHYITFAPDMKWGIVDYYQQKKLSFDYVKKAYQPILPSLKYEKRRWLPQEVCNIEAWIVNDFYSTFNHLTVEIAVLDNYDHLIYSNSHSVSSISPDSAKKYFDFSFTVSGAIGDRISLSIKLLDEHNELVAENDYFLLVADKVKDHDHMKKMGAEAFEAKQKFGWANYFRYFPELCDEEFGQEGNDHVPVARGFKENN